MTAMTLETGFNQTNFEAFTKRRDEPDWLRTQRENAWRAFCELPLPSTGDEEWRRTDLRLLRLDNFAPPGEIEEAAELPPALLASGVELGGQTISHNCRPLEQSLDDKWASQGVVFGSLETIVHTHGDLVREHLFRRAVGTDADKFAALHAACWSGGALLYVPAGVTVDEPLHMLSTISDGGVDFGHTLVILEDGAEATLLAETASQADAAGLHCGAVELILAPGSRLRYVNLQNWGNKVWHFARQKAIVDRDAALQWTIGALGARLAKVNQDVALVGPGADAQVNGVMFTEHRQHLAYHTLQHHEAANCHSDLLYKGALQDQSRLIWRGMIKVDPDAQKTNGYQRNDNLMLSDHARADSIPGLEIEADDVICTHGSTTGRVDDELIFYARCRGLTRKEAIRMIVAGFFQKVFDRITIDSVREALAHAIGRRIREFD